MIVRSTAVQGRGSGALGTARDWATALALAWLEQHAASHVGEWRALADQARAWLAREPTHVPADGASWQDAATDWLAGAR
jgi:hypothetical protein